MHFFKQIFKFSLTGAVAFVIDFGGYFVITRSFEIMRVYYIAASLLTSFTAIGVGYLINRRWTFNDSSRISMKQYSRYLLVYASGAIWQNSLLVFFVERMTWHDLAAKITAVLMVAFCWNFLLAKFWVFGYNIKVMTKS